MSLTGIASMLVDAGNTSAGTPTFSTFGRSPRAMNFEDASLIRMCGGAQVTASAGSGHTITYNLEYSIDAVNGVGGTWTNITQLGPFDTTYSMQLSQWVAIPGPAQTDATWLRISFDQTLTGGTTSLSFIEVYYK